MSKIVIGALVGMGPNSTAPFYNAVMNYARKLYGAKNDMDFPEMVLISLPTPFVPGIEPDHQQMLSILTNAITQLNHLQVNYIVIPNNIVHRYYENLQKASAVPVLNIVDVTVNKLSALSANNTKVALIGTSTTIEANLYQKQLLKRNYEIFYTQELQSKVNKLLVELKANNLSEQAKTFWKDVVNYLEANNCVRGIIACTDISPCVSFYSENLLWVDSMDALAEATIKQYMHLTGNHSLG